MSRIEHVDPTILPPVDKDPRQEERKLVDRIDLQRKRQRGEPVGEKERAQSAGKATLAEMLRAKLARGGENGK